MFKYFCFFWCQNDQNACTKIFFGKNVVLYEICSNKSKVTNTLMGHNYWPPNEQLWYAYTHDPRILLTLFVYLKVIFVCMDFVFWWFKHKCWFFRFSDFISVYIANLSLNPLEQIFLNKKQVRKREGTSKNNV
jgi:hypothetical protein